ncbi:MAG: carboxypeptidase-like regulatory domain-containing protein [Planctomycetes bacterium]|nr:carboxypeptidase-like regulatory domain-containing protein [Planctomycetota bacterium]
MRRAAIAAIALVALLLLFPRESGLRRSVRSEPPPEPAGLPPAGPEAGSAPLASGEGATGAKGVVASGVVTDARGNPCAGIRLLALPAGHAAHAEAFTPPGEDPTAPFAFCDAEGAFAFLDLPEGEHWLVIDDSEWMLDNPLRFRAGARDLRVVASATWSPEVQVRDLATRERVPRFVVRYRWPPDAPEERLGEGIDGVFRVRLPRTDLAPFAPCAIEAQGYRGTQASLSLAGTVTWLLAVAEPRLTLRVLFEDGEPCEEDAEAILERWGGSVVLPAERAGSGRYRVTVPPGSWGIGFRPAKHWGEPCEASFDLAEGESKEVYLKLARGGNVVVRREPWDGKPWLLRVFCENHMTFLHVTDRVWEARHVRPGRYTFATTVDWESMGTLRQSEVEVTTGSRHELAIE